VALLIGLIVRTARRTGAAGVAVHAARQAMAGSEARYLTTFDAMPIAAVEIDSARRTIGRGNAAFLDLVHRRESDLTGRALVTVVLPVGGGWQVETSTGVFRRVTLVEHPLTIQPGEDRSLVFVIPGPS
jgi:PAS domain-containing protein